MPMDTDSTIQPRDAALDGTLTPRNGFLSRKERAEFEMAHGRIMDPDTQRSERDREGD